ncbi:MAG: hypothetical protein Q8P07_04705 [bacterium]|nr:hypothetical protein [bacterium]
MNSAQRRKTKRKWLRKNAEGINKIINWINAPNRFVMSRFMQGDYIEMEPELLIASCRGSYSFTKVEWMEYLIRKGINPERFKQSSEELKLISSC